MDLDVLLVTMYVFMDAIGDLLASNQFLLLSFLIESYDLFNHRYFFNLLS